MTGQSPVEEDTTLPGRFRHTQVNAFMSRRGNRHLVMALMLALVILLTTWPEDAEDRVYEGELWGDLEAEGYIWGEQKAEYDYVSFWLGDMTVNVTNVSAVWLSDPPFGERINSTVECHNRSLTIVSRSDDFGWYAGYCWDIDMRCVYSDFNGTFVDKTDSYFPDYNVSWMEGHASVRHNDSLDADIALYGCNITIDGVVYESASYVRVVSGDNVQVSVRGAGSVYFVSPMFPHINGTLRMENFKHVENGHSDRYQQLVIKGKDIALRTVNPSDSGSGGGPFGGTFYSPWEVEVSASQDASIDIFEAFKLPIYAELVVIATIAVLAIGILKRPCRPAIGPAPSALGRSEGVVRPPDARP